MTGLSLLLKCCINWIIMSIVLHSVTGNVTLTADSMYMVSFQPLTLSCTFDDKPDGEIVSFHVNEIRTARVKFFPSTSKCFIERFKNGTSIGGGECNDDCDCQLDGKSYIWSYNSTLDKDTMTFKCEGTIRNDIEGQTLDVSKAKSPSGININPNRTSFYFNETEETDEILCKASCVPDCGYNWTTPYGIISSKAFSIPSVSRNQTGIYTCTAWNIFGNKTTSIKIYVQYRPSVKITPGINPYKVRENDKNLTVTCIVNDAFPIDQIWYSFTGPIGPTIHSQYYTISSVQTNHSGTYTCIASNAAGTSDGADLTIDVLYGPVISEMNNVNITEKMSFTQTCVVKANPIASRIWWSRSNQLDVFREGAELNISNITRLLDDTYTCNALNNLVPSYNNQTSINNNRSFSINVQYGPEIMKIQDVNVTENSDFTVTCNVTANPQPSRVWWTHKQQSNVEQEGTILELKNIPKTSSGDIFCHAENILHPTYPSIENNVKKNVSRSFQINVQYGPVITNIEDVNITENEPFNISCNVSSNPIANRVWWTRSQIKGDVNGTDLIFQNIERTHADFFTCHAENILYPSDTNFAVKQSNNRTFYINVQYGPGSSIQIIPSLFNVNVTEKNDVINISCQANCNPSCSYQWTNDSSYIISSGHLLNKDVHRYDAGNYTCSAKNTIPASISTISVKINVLYAATIYDISQITTINESLGFILECKVDSFPLSTITWRLNRTNEIVSKSSQYKVQTAFCNQTGVYVCSAFSGIPPEAVRHTELQIRCSPRLNIEYQSSASTIGIGEKEPLNITVYFISYPEPLALRWIFYKHNSSEYIIKQSNCYSFGKFEHMACFFNSNVTEADFGIYKLQVTFTYLEIWEQEFKVEGNRKPDQPQKVNVSCGIEEVHLKWKSAFNGGEKQTFFILVITDTSSYLVSSKSADNGIGTPFAEEVILQSGQYSFAIFANNSYGSVTSERLNCTISARQIPIRGSPSLIGAVVGCIAGILVLCVSGLVGFFVVRKRFTLNKGKDTDTLQRSCLHNIDEEEDELKDNPMYESSGPDVTDNTSSGDVYSSVEKRKASSLESQPNTNNAVYAHVVKNTKKGKEKASKKDKHVTDKFIEMGSVYENSSDMKEKQTHDVYANTIGKDFRENGYQTKKNKDGLIYADLDLAPGPSGKKFVIRGLENKNNYAIIDLTKTAEPLPSDSENEEATEQ